MKAVFLDASTLGDTSLEPVERLCDLTCWPTSTPAEALDRVRDAEILIVNKIKVTASLLDHAPQLRLICEAATGVNNIDLEAAAARGIPVRNVAGYSTDAVAQLAFAQILDLVCDCSRHDAYVKDGRYSGSEIFTEVSAPFAELSGKTIGIAGMGAIGGKVAQIASAFGMKVLHYSTSGAGLKGAANEQGSGAGEQDGNETSYPLVSLDELLRSSDVISIHCPLTQRTMGLIGAAELAKMKPSAILVNMARGGIVDEAALAEAVGSGQISGAAVDVFTTEPLSADNPLLHCARPDRLRLTPHLAWASAEALDRLVEGIARNIAESCHLRESLA